MYNNYFIKSHIEMYCVMYNIFSMYCHDANSFQWKICGTHKYHREFQIVLFKK